MGLLSFIITRGFGGACLITTRGYGGSVFGDGDIIVIQAEGLCPEYEIVDYTFIETEMTGEGAVDVQFDFATSLIDRQWLS